MSADRQVYFARPVGQLGPIKIGCSANPGGRLASFNSWSPVRLELVATTPGNFCNERRLHAHFAATRLHGEWFEATQELLDVIEKCRAGADVFSALAKPRWLDMAEQYLAGGSLEEVSSRHGLTRERVRQILAANGIMRRPAGRGRIEVEQDDAA